MNNGNRKHWIDIAKGIAIVLMVLGHTSIPDTLSRFIFAFHMPLFFMASGYTSNWDKYDVCYFIRHKIRTILLPFTLYSIVVAIVMEVMQEQDVMALLKNGWGVCPMVCASFVPCFCYSTACEDCSKVMD